jgi:hypothetical protein
MMCFKPDRLGLLAIVGLLLALLLFAIACGGEEAGESQLTPTPTPTPTPALTPGATPPTVLTPSLTPAATPLSTPLPGACQPQVPVEGESNLFHNPGFEAGRDPWCSLHQRWTPFEVSNDYAHSGQSSALMRMRVPADVTEEVEVHSLTQELTLAEFPELISGYYRVENWTKGTPKQYLQFVVIVFNATNLPSPYTNHQMRYPLAGISQQPFEIGNSGFVFLSTEEPRTGEWVYFERNIKQDFEDMWEAVPEGFSKIRVIFEVRYDDKVAGTAPAEADVYYDDLYMGPASDNPNRP